MQQKKYIKRSNIILKHKINSIFLRNKSEIETSSINQYLNKNN